MMRNVGSSCSLLALTAAGLLVGVPAKAQSAPDAAASQAERSNQSIVGEVVVTAQRRSELSRDVPITITTMSATQLQQADVRQLSDIVKLTPALRFDYQGGSVQPTIRGVGVSTITSGMGSNVGIYADGFYSPNPLAANFDLLNVQNVQVLKGPQGTLFGRNTTGGAILVTTAKPSHETGGLVEASYSRFDTQRYQAYVTTGITDQLAVDAEGLYSESDGYLHNIHTGDKKAGASKNWGFRVGAKYDATDKLSFLLRYQHFDDNDPTAATAGNLYVSPQGRPLGVAAVLPGALVATRPGDVANNQLNRFFVRSSAVQLTSTYDLNFATLTSYTQWRKDYAENDLDFDGSNISAGAVLVPMIDKIFTQEFLLASKTPGPLQWTAGLFFFRDDNRFHNVALSSAGSPYTPIINNGTVSVSYAGYADVTYEAIHNLFVTAGIRYSRDEVQNGFFEFIGAPRVDVPTLKYDHATPRFVIRYKPDDNSSVYFSYAKGYKAPILSVGGFSTEALAPEKITAYEVGYKYGRGSLSLDAAAYHYAYKDLQVTSWRGTMGVYSNAANSKVDGAEAQVRYQVMRGLEVNAGAGYTDAKFKSFPNAPGYQQCLDAATCGANYGLLELVQVDASGLRMPRSPKFTGNLGVSYRTDMAGGELVLSSNLYYTSKVYFDAASQFQQRGYELLGLRAEWTDPSRRYTLAVFGNNVTGKRYRLQVNPSPTSITNMWSAPAIWGASVRARF